MQINFYAFYIGSILRLLGFSFDDIRLIIKAIAGWIS